MEDKTETAFNEAIATGDWSGFVPARVKKIDIAAFEARRRDWFHRFATEAQKERLWNEQVARVRNGCAWCATIPQPPEGWVPWERNR